jgi:hypothetical protein
VGDALGLLQARLAGGEQLLRALAGADVHARPDDVRDVAGAVAQRRERGVDAHQLAVAR